MRRVASWVVGLGIVAVPTGLVASALSEARQQDKAWEVKELNDEFAG